MDICPTELVSLRAAFYISDWSRIESEARGQRMTSDDSEIQNNCFVARAYIEQGKLEEALTTIGSARSPALKIVRLLVDFEKNPSSEKARQLIVEKVDAVVNPDSDAFTKIQAATLFLRMNLHAKALKVIWKEQSSDAFAIRVQIYISIHRTDLALKEVKKMRTIDDDDVLSSLAMAWVCLSQGGPEKAAEAYRELQDVIDKFGNSVKILNTQAICQMSQRKFDDALELLKEARELALQNEEVCSPTTLVNLLVCLQHAQKLTPSWKERITTELKKNCPDHPYFARTQKLEKSFDKAFASFST